MPVSSARLQNLPPYIFAIIGQKIAELKKEGHDVIRIDIGSPDLPPADFVIEALAQSARNPENHGYSGYRGTPAYRKSVANYYKKRFDVNLNPDTEVLPLLGSKEGIINLSLAYLDKGDIVLVPSIGYPSYAMGARLANAEIYWVPMSPENNFLLELDNIPVNILQQAKLLWINYPNNPTGAVADLKFYEDVVQFCKQHDILLVSDNPYVDVTFDDYQASSLLEVAGAKSIGVELMSFSKTFNMAGWRLGAAIGAADALKTLLQVKSNVDSGHFIGVYDAGIAAMDCTTPEWIQKRNAVYARRRDKILAALPHIGLNASKPQASLYIWAHVADMDSQTYVNRALSEAHVSIAPGPAYGPGGENFVRISVSVEDERLDEALERLKAWYAKIEG